MELTDGMKDHVQNALEKVRGHFDKVIDVDVILSVEKHRQLAEFNLHANGLRINAKEQSEDLYASIDTAVEKLDRQVRKHKERIQRHKPRSTKEKQEYHHQIIGFGTEGEGSSDENPAPHHVIHRETIPMKPMSVDEASLQLDLQDDLFLVFSNADTHRINVLYKHSDGTYGLIEPQY